MSQITLGGERLGSGKKQKISLHNYERSSHDLSYVWRSTMASGTLVPFMSEVALPGDSFDIDLEADIKTHPTIGPLFGSYKVQLDVFVAPIRLYQGKLHMNMLGIGMKMNTIKLPLVELTARQPQSDRDLDNQQVNPSCIFSYLNIRGVGFKSGTHATEDVKRTFNAVPWLAYWDIYKNYYANKQEEVGYVIHNDLKSLEVVLKSVKYKNAGQADKLLNTTNFDTTPATVGMNAGSSIEIEFTTYQEFDLALLEFRRNGEMVKAYDMFPNWVWDPINKKLTGLGWQGFAGANIVVGYYKLNYNPSPFDELEPRMQVFPLGDIDKMRELILTSVSDPTAVKISKTTNLQPYKFALTEKVTGTVTTGRAIQSNQEGLGLKTYQSDLFNNWVSTEWIDGANGINEITKISTLNGEFDNAEAHYFNLDTLNLSKKIYEMLNRIAVSGGTYDDWLDATYTHERTKSIENPMYVGGLSKELVFQEVISNSASEMDMAGNQQPLGTLAGRGVLNGKNKGGKIKIRVDEPSYIMGIISLTPRVDYSQGNKWDVNLKTMDDFHKPGLDEIGFQDLITEQMAWWETEISEINGKLTMNSAGKQPAWINYMTNVNVTRGNFAIASDQMFMTLNRRYEGRKGLLNKWRIQDLTTYIDPSKFNHIFAYTRRDAQNFWAQIGVNIQARRKMSAKVMPNL